MKNKHKFKSQTSLLTKGQIDDYGDLRQHPIRIIFVLIVFLIGFLFLIVIRAIQDKKDIYENALINESIRASEIISVTEANLENIIGTMQSVSRFSGNKPKNLINIKNNFISAASIVKDQTLYQVYPLEFKEIFDQAWKNIKATKKTDVNLVPENHKTTYQRNKTSSSPYLVVLHPLKNGQYLAALVNLDLLIPFSDNKKPLAIATKQGAHVWKRLSNGNWRANGDLQSAYRLSKIQIDYLLQSGKYINTNTQNTNAQKIKGEYNRFVFASAKSNKHNLIAISTKPLDPLLSSWYYSLIFYAILIIIPLIVTFVLSKIILDQFNSIADTQTLAQESEHRYKLSLEGADCGAWEWDTETGNVYISDLLAKMTGHKKAGIISGDLFISEFQNNQQDSIILELRNTKTNNIFDIKLNTVKTNNVIHMRGKPWIDPKTGKKHNTIIGVALNITAEVAAHQKLTDTENKLKMAIESMSEAFALWNPKRKLILWNSKFETFFNIPKDQINTGVDYNHLDLLAQKEILQVKETDNQHIVEMELKNSRWIQFSEHVTKNGNWVNVGSDITTIKQHENALISNETKLKKSISELSRSQKYIAELAKEYEQEKLKAEQASRSKSAFLANMSHELRTPLNAINGFSEIILKQMFGPVGDSRYSEYIRDIHSSGQHLLSLINDILDMSKIEAGKMNLKMEILEPIEIIDQVIRILRGKAIEGKLKLKRSIKVLPDIEADSRALKQILLNLVSNAIKFTPEGGEVVIKTKMEEQYVQFSVSDTGTGISEEDVKSLGQSFFQAENHQSKKHQGTGLGLALSKSLIELHHGKLQIESELGKGTIVSFIIPYQQPKQNQKIHKAEHRSKDHITSPEEEDNQRTLDSHQRNSTQNETKPNTIDSGLTEKPVPITKKNNLVKQNEPSQKIEKKETKQEKSAPEKKIHQKNVKTMDVEQSNLKITHAMLHKENIKIEQSPPSKTNSNFSIYHETEQHKSRQKKSENLIRDIRNKLDQITEKDNKQRTKKKKRSFP